jgi:hypothetical protein
VKEWVENLLPQLINSQVRIVVLLRWVVELGKKAAVFDSG